MTVAEFRGQYDLPALKGTEKQIKFANDLIDKIITRDLDKKEAKTVKGNVWDYLDMLEIAEEKCNTEEVKKIMSENNMTKADLIKENAERYGFEVWHTIFTSDKSWEIIEVLL